MGGIVNFWEFIYCIIVIFCVGLFLLVLKKINQFLKLKTIDLMLEVLFLDQNVIITSIFVIVISWLFLTDNIIGGLYLIGCGMVLIMVAMHEYKNHISGERSVLSKIFTAIVLIGLPIVVFVSNL